MKTLADISQFESLMNDSFQAVNNAVFNLPVSRRCYQEGLQKPEDLDDIRDWINVVDDPDRFDDVDDYPYWIRSDIYNRIGSDDYCPDAMVDAIDDVLKEGRYEERLQNWINELSDLDKERLRIYDAMENDGYGYITRLLGAPTRTIPENLARHYFTSAMWGENVHDVDSLYENLNREISKRVKDSILQELSKYHAKNGERLNIPDWLRKNKILDRGYPEKDFMDYDTKASGYPLEKKLIQAIEENKNKFGQIGDEGQADVLEEVVRSLGDNAYNLSKPDRLISLLTLHKNPASRDRNEKLATFLERLKSYVDYQTSDVKRLEDELSVL